MYDTNTFSHFKVNLGQELQPNLKCSSVSEGFQVGKHYLFVNGMVVCFNIPKLFRQIGLGKQERPEAACS